MSAAFASIDSFLVSAGLASKWGVWGVMPVVAYVAGFLCTALPLEVLIRLPFMRPFLIKYKNVSESRESAWRKLHATLPLVPTQIVQVAWVLLGPVAIVNGVFAALIGDTLMPRDYAAPIAADVPSALTCLVQYLVMFVVNDFVLYWGHRLQHTIPALWKTHAKHHTLDTPTPLGTIYIESNDATLQGALPILVATVIARPHPLVMWAFVALRVAENVVNHSGLRAGCVPFDLVSLKFLPGRASVAHHDSHHRFSNHGGDAKNYGESLVLWDWMFGSLRSTR